MFKSFTNFMIRGYNGVKALAIEVLIVLLTSLTTLSPSTSIVMTANAYTDNGSDIGYVKYTLNTL